MYSDKKDKK